jgi:hypothetical protein
MFRNLGDNEIDRLNPIANLDEWRDIVAYTSCSPQGPWTNRTVVYQAPESDELGQRAAGLTRRTRLGGGLLFHDTSPAATHSGA